MEDAEEKDMDLVASFKSGKTLAITDKQYDVCSPDQTINLLVSTNRYGYVFYGTENKGLAVISSTYIDRESSYLSKISEDDDDDDDANENTKPENVSISYRSYLPGMESSSNSSIIPVWLSLNADETILAIVLSRLDASSLVIVLYDVVQLIQSAMPSPLCQPHEFRKEDVGGTIYSLLWNPVLVNYFAYINGRGCVSTFEFDSKSKQLRAIGIGEENENNSAICWSPKGKQLVVVTYDGALQLYEPDMKLKKKYSSAVVDMIVPPCLNVIWLSTHQFLLGFSDNDPDEANNSQMSSFFQLVVTYGKNEQQIAKIQVYNDLFFDAESVLNDIVPQYFSVHLSNWKILICGLSKSLKINVLGANELSQDTFDIWTFGDQFRPIVKGPNKASTDRPILTGMTIGLNSTLSIVEGTTKFSPCPILLLSNSEGLLQVYYFIHKTLPSICQKPEIIELNPPLSMSSFNLLPSFIVSQSTTTTPTTATASNGFSFASTIGVMPPSLTKDKTGGNVFNIDQLSSMNPTRQIVSSSTTTTNGSSSSIENNHSVVVNNKKLLQMIDQFHSQLHSLEKPSPKLAESSSIDVLKSLQTIAISLKTMLESLQTANQTIKTMTNEQIESLTRIEDGLHRIKLIQKENFYNLLQDRELDPWTQIRLDSIKINYDQLKHNFNVLLQLTHTTINDKSLNNEDIENEDFMPDLELSLNTGETMQHRIQQRIRELGRKVSETEKDLQILCQKLKTLSLSTIESSSSSSNSKMFDSTFIKTRHSRTADVQLLTHLQAIHKTVNRIRVPPAAAINLSTNIEQKKASTIETSKVAAVPGPPSTPKQTVSSSPTVLASLSPAETEGFKNMLRIVRTSIDLFSGATSPEQLQALSNTIITSPISSSQKVTTKAASKTPTVPKVSTAAATATRIPTLSMGQPGPVSSAMPMTATTISPAFSSPPRSISSAIPAISVTPATPAMRPAASDAALKSALNQQPIAQTATDLSKPPISSSNEAIRSLLNDPIVSSPPVSTTLNLSQPTVVPASSSVITKVPQPFGSTPSGGLFGQTTSATPASTTTTTTTSIISPQLPTTSSFGVSPSVSSVAPTTTPTIAIQSVSPTIRPLTSTGISAFGSRPIFGSTGFGVTPATSTSLPFGSGAFGSLSTTATSLPGTSPFSGFSATSTAPTTTGTIFGGFSAPSTSTTSTPSALPFGAGFGTGTTSMTTSAPSTFPFAGGFGTLSTTATSAPSASLFGSGFGSNSTMTTSALSPSPFGSGFSTASTATPSALPSASPFGAAVSPTTTTSAPPPFGGGFGATTPAPASTTNAAATPTTSIFGGGGTSTFGSSGASGFGSGFTGFTTQSASSSSPVGFSFGGFGSQPGEGATPASSFSSFGSSATTQPGSPFGSVLFSGASAPTQSGAFGTSNSSFGASSTQSATSPSFTAYRK